MNTKVAELAQRIHQLEEELEVELAEARVRFRYYFEQGKVRFEEGVAAEHRRLRKGLLKFLAGTEVRDIVGGGMILAMIVPVVILDLFLILYQFIAFGLYDIQKVRRSDFIFLDRQHLAYLNGIEKLNCMYCSYANGLFAWAKVIAGRTEQYWCPIKHARRVHAAHTRYARFIDYGDAENYRRELARLREELKPRREEFKPHE